MAFTARMKDLMRKYGKVALGVHVSVSVASVSGMYVAINNNVDVDAIFRKIGPRSRRRRRGPPPPRPRRRRRPGGAAEPDRGARGVQRRRARARHPVQQGPVPRQGPHHHRAHAAHRQAPRPLEARQE
uniref:DUF1279 domain-containing protein n=1 Tax=Aegilops tauschii subsp. strangulata TaxID=200361 RepID=A0A453LHJ5_AEGTS